jgi:hypothetical protein
VAGFVRKASTRQSSRPTGRAWSHSTGWPGFEVIITEVAIWMMDSYDFEDDQSLGWWDEKDNSVIRFLPSTQFRNRSGVMAAAGDPKHTEVEGSSRCPRLIKI